MPQMKKLVSASKPYVQGLKSYIWDLDKIVFSTLGWK